jgi:hypothetical protein
MTVPHRDPRHTGQPCPCTPSPAARRIARRNDATRNLRRVAPARPTRPTAPPAHPGDPASWTDSDHTHSYGRDGRCQVLDCARERPLWLSRLDDAPAATRPAASKQKVLGFAIMGMVTFGLLYMVGNALTDRVAEPVVPQSSLVTTP